MRRELGERDSIISLRTLAQDVLRDEGGQDLVEYALLASFIGLLAVAGANALGSALERWYDAIFEEVDASAGTVAS